MKYVLLLILSIYISACSNEDLGDICGYYKYEIPDSCTTQVYIYQRSSQYFYIELEHEDYNADNDNRIFMISGKFSKFPSDSIISDNGKYLGDIKLKKGEVTVYSKFNNKTYIGYKYEESDN